MAPAIFRSVAMTIGILFAYAFADLVPAASEQPKVVYTEPATQRSLMTANSIDQQFLITVHQPIMKADGSERFPVLYMVDANDGIPAKHQLTLLQQGGDLNRFIIVGIGYPVDTHLQASFLRQRDLTPTIVEEVSGHNSTNIQNIVEIEGDAATGNAAKFQRFISEQLIPHIDETYPTAAGERVFFGHSFGSLFGLNLFLTSPEMFGGYIFGSPSLWYDEEIMFERLTTFIESKPSVNTKMFLGVGALEERPAPAAKMLSNVVRLDAQLMSGAIPGLELETKIYDGHSHYSVPFPILVDGLRFTIGTGPACLPLWADCPETVPDGATSPIDQHSNTEIE